MTGPSRRTVLQGAAIAALAGTNPATAPAAVPVNTPFAIAAAKLPALEAERDRVLHDDSDDGPYHRAWREHYDTRREAIHAEPQSADEVAGQIRLFLEETEGCQIEERDRDLFARWADDLVRLSRGGAS